MCNTKGPLHNTETFAIYALRRILATFLKPALKKMAVFFSLGLRFFSCEAYLE